MPKSDYAESEKIAVSARVLADIFDCPTRTIHQLASEGIVRKLDIRGQYDLVPSARAVFDLEREKTTSEELVAEKLRELKARRVRTELSNLRTKAELLDRADVERAWTTVLVAIRQNLLRIGASLGHVMADCKDANRAAKLLDDWIRDQLSELSDSEADLYDFGELSQDVETAPETDG